MTPLIFNLLQISILMSVAAIILHLVLKVFSNSIPPKWKYYIWGIVLISLLIPFRPRFTEPIVTVDAPESLAGGFTGNSSIAPETDSSAIWTQIDIPALIIGIWIAGVVVFLGIIFVRHLHFMHMAKRWGTQVVDELTLDLVRVNKAEMNISTDIEVIRSKMVSVPMMAGVFKPILFLPVYDLDEEELTYVIRHELVHYRKFDILLKFLSILANAVHWFNPIVYIMQRWIHTDCEVACDFEVTKTYEHEERVKYAESIIGVAKHEVKYKTVFSTNFYDGKKTMKKRLESVLSDYKMRTAVVAVVISALVIICIIAGSALAVSSGDENAVPYIGEKKAGELALEKTGGGELISFSYDDKGGSRVYKILISDGEYDYTITMDAANGDLMNYEKNEIKDNVTAEKNKSDSNTESTGNNSSATTGNSGSSGSDSSSKNTGSSSNQSAGTTEKSSSIISEAKAKSIALKKVGGGTVTKCKLESDDGIKKYEIKINYKNYEYEIDIDAKTGKIIDFEKDEIEHHDHDDDHDD